MTFSGCVRLVGIYLLDIIYIDSAYPASESIIETEQRTNQMNNVLRVISDLQMSCNYGKAQEATYISLSGYSSVFICSVGNGIGIYTQIKMLHCVNITL